MPSDREREDIDLREAFGPRYLNYKTAIVGAIVFGAIGLAVHLFAPPIYRAEMTLVFPEAKSAEMTPLSNVLGGMNENAIGFVAGLLSTQSAQQRIGKEVELTPVEVRKSMSIEPDLPARQLRVGFNNPDSKNALTALQVAAEFIRTTNSDVTVGASSARLTGIRERLAKKQELIDQYQVELLDALENSETVPTQQDQYTGGGYLKELQDVQFQLASVKQKIKAAQGAAGRLEGASAQGLPTGLEMETAWKEKLIEAQLRFDNARAKYQPTSPQYQEAEQMLRDVKQGLQQGIADYARSVQEGLNKDMAQLLAQQLVLEFQSENLRKKALAAPTEATRFRELLAKIDVEQDALKIIRQEEEKEELRISTAVPEWIMVDEPYLVAKPVNKSLLLNIGVPTFAGLFVGLIFGARRRPS